MEGTSKTICLQSNDFPNFKDNLPKNPEPKIFNSPPMKPKDYKETKKVVSTFFMSQSPKWTPKFQPILVDMDIENFRLN
jgi:hypothetical protein